MLWLLLLLLIAAEVAALWWWLTHEYYPVFFNGWAVTLYTLALAADAVFVWLVSLILDPHSSSGFEILAIFCIVAVLLVTVFTLFLRWVVRQDLPGAPK